jgi:hypothetical protein
MDNNFQIVCFSVWVSRIRNILAIVAALLALQMPFVSPFGSQPTATSVISTPRTPPAQRSAAMDACITAVDIPTDTLAFMAEPAHVTKQLIAIAGTAVPSNTSEPTSTPTPTSTPHRRARLDRPAHPALPESCRPNPQRLLLPAVAGESNRAPMAIAPHRARAAHAEPRAGDAARQRVVQRRAAAHVGHNSEVTLWWAGTMRRGEDSEDTDGSGVVRVMSDE